MIRLLLEQLRRTGREEGAVALLTLVFMMTVGMVMVIVLFGMSYVSAAHTTLYQATQAAAYAAANEIVTPANGGGTSQLPFDCGPNFDWAQPSPVCTSGRTAQAAKTLLSDTLNGAGGKFGLSFPGSVRLVDTSGNTVDGPLAYYVSDSAGVAQAEDPGCGGIYGNTRTCWTNPVGDIGVGDSNYVSGVVVITQATVPFVPGCTSWICPTFTIQVAVSARAGQVIPGKNYNAP